MAKTQRPKSPRTKEQTAKASKTGKKSRDKGHGFERTIAKELREILGLEMKDIFRTPLSGGHPGMRAGDLMLSKKAQRLFPWSVECKHYKGWRPDSVLKDNLREQGWTTQCVAAACFNGNLRPMLIMNGSNTGAYFAARRSNLKELAPELLQAYPRTLYRNKGDGGQVWVQLPWSAMVAYLRTI